MSLPLYDAGPAVPAVRLAVVGCGHWGRNLVRNFARLGVLRAVVDENPETTRMVADEAGVDAMDFDAVLKNPGLEAVVIAAPASQHFSLAWAALDAGKDVFVEKPLALRLDDAERLCDLAKANDRVLMVGHLLQYHAAFQRLRELVAEGALGRLQYVYSNRLNLGRFRREEDILWSFAPHDISMILALVQQEPASVHAVGSTYLHERIADVTTTHLTFANGVNAHVFVSWLHPFKEQKLVVVGSHGMAVFDDGEAWERKLQYENEVCPVFLCRLTGELAASPAEVAEVRWISWQDCVRQALSPGNELSPWSVRQIAALHEGGLAERFLASNSPPAGRLEDGTSG